MKILSLFFLQVVIAERQWLISEVMENLEPYQQLWTAQVACASGVSTQGPQRGDRDEKPQSPPAVGPVSLISKTFSLGVLSLGLCHWKWCLVAEVGRCTTSASLWVFQGIRYFSGLTFSYKLQLLNRHNSLNKLLLSCHISFHFL